MIIDIKRLYINYKDAERLDRVWHRANKSYERSERVKINKVLLSRLPSEAKKGSRLRDTKP